MTAIKNMVNHTRDTDKPLENQTHFVRFQKINKMTECIFCKIARGEIKQRKFIYEDNNFLAFSDAYPVSEGHTLLITKRHFETILDLNEDISKKYITTIKEVAKILMKKYKADGFNVLLNNGKAAGQKVNHVHFHIVPRKDGDKKSWIFTD